MEKNELNDKIITMSESVLFDEQERTNLLNKTGKYNVKDIKTIVRILNVYMNMVISSQNDLDKSLFDYVNKLNEIYGVSTHYNYAEYLKKEFKINRITIIKILCDPLYFRLFLDFDNYRDIFKEEKRDYLLALDSFVKYMELENKQLKDIALRRYKYIAERNSLGFSRKMLVPGDKVMHNIDSTFENCIMKGIDLAADKLTIARHIYLKLCYGMRYDINYTKYDLSYENNVHNVETKSLCWANIYASLLNKLGINALVCGEENKYVILEIDGVYIKADALTFNQDNMGFIANDLLRVKMCLTSKGFKACDAHNDISKLLEEIDNKLGMKLETTANLNTKMKNHYQDEDKLSETKKKLSLLSFYVMNSNTMGTEWLRHMGFIVNMLFNLEEKKAYCAGVHFKNEAGNLEEGIVLSLDYNDELNYFCLTRKKNIKQVTKKALIVMLSNGKMLLNSTDDIKGLEAQTEMILKRNKKD